MIGYTLDGRYAIRSRIARGGMAMVYLANDLRLERRVAVKVMHDHLAEDENFRRRFDQEARSAARLSHPNLVNVFDQGIDAGRNYLVMEYLPSITLRELLKQQRSLTREQTIEISEAILAGLSAAHLEGIVHRDLKPENVLLADDGRIKLGDFGLARAVSANTTTGQALLGTIAYLSPELVTRGIADARSDLYAFGIMLYEMLAGVQPYTGEQPMQIAYQHAHSDVPMPSLVSDESTPELDELVRWLTRRDPEERPADAGAALAHLRAIVNGSASAVVPQDSTTVMPTLAPTTAFTPSTAVLDDAQIDELENSQGTDELHAPVTPLDRAADAAHVRKRRGSVLALITAVAIAGAAGAGWWFGQGPGSQAKVPDVAGLSIDSALSSLEQASLVGSVISCSSLDIAIDLAVSTDPEAGSRVERGTTVTVCQSTGPEILTVPTIAGLLLDDAKAAIKVANFSFGEVKEERFSEEPKGTVLAALDENGEQLGDSYPEMGTIDLVVSAGKIPEVVGEPKASATQSLESARLVVDAAKNSEVYSSDVTEGSVVEVIFTTDPVHPSDAVHLVVSAGSVPDVAGEKKNAAVKTLKSAGLVVDDTQSNEAYDDVVPKGHVLAVLFTTDPVRPGDTVGLTISLGPELFPVPDVAGMGLQEAMDSLAAAGFSPTTGVPDILRDIAEATKTDPPAGTELPAGTSVAVRATVSL